MELINQFYIYMNNPMQISAGQQKSNKIDLNKISSFTNQNAAVGAKKHQSHLYTSSNPESFMGLENTIQSMDLHNQVMRMTEQASTQPTRAFDGLQIKGVLGGHETPKQLISGKRPKVGAGATADMNELIGKYERQNKEHVWDSLEKQQIPNHIVDSGILGAQLQMHEKWSRFHDPSNSMDSGSARAFTHMDTSGRDSDLSSSYGMVTDAEKRAGRLPTSSKPSQHQQQSDQKGIPKKAHFFESRSKYVTLNSDSQEKFMIINKWYRSLSLSDKAMALTIVDKELVQLFRSMYRTEHTQGMTGGKFSTQVQDCQDFWDQNQLCQVAMQPDKAKQLVYIKQQKELGQRINSSVLREKECALSELVENIRIVSVRQPNDAITIDIELISNIDYFMKIMKLVDEEFLIREYKLTKEAAVTGSLLFQKEDSETTSSKKGQYFHVADPQKQVYYATIGTQSGIQTNYAMQSRHHSLQQSYITLAKCILLSFEKCLNVHFLEHQKKLTSQQSQQFFLKPTEITTNPFSEDDKLAKWWLSLNLDQKKTHLEAAKDMEREIVLQHNSLKFETVNESEDENSDEWQSSAKAMQQIQCESQDSQFGKQRRKRKDRKQHTQNGSDRTSSSGLQNSNSIQSNPYYNDYNQKQLRLQYGDDDSQDDYDLESQTRTTIQPMQQTQSQLFLNIDNSMFKYRNSLVQSALQTQDMTQCLMFIKQLSLWKSFENSMRENAQGEISPKLINDVKRILHKKYYEYLEEAFQKSVLDDLINAEDESTKEEPSKSKKKNNKKKRRKNKNKEEAAQPVAAKDQPSTAAAAAAKEQPKQTIREEPPLSPKIKTIEQLGKSLGVQLGGGSPLAAKAQEALELPQISIKFDKSSFKELALHQDPPPVEETATELQQQLTPSQSSEDSSQVSKALECVHQTFKIQDDMLMLMARKIEKISTCEKMLDQGVLHGISTDFLEQLLRDSDSDYDTKDVDQLNDQVEQLSSFWRQKKLGDDDLEQGRYEEERTGLLTNMVHHEKYSNTQELIDDQSLSDRREQLKYLREGQFSINCDAQMNEMAFSDEDSDDIQLKKIREQIDGPAFNKIVEKVKQNNQISLSPKQVQVEVQKQVAPQQTPQEQQQQVPNAKQRKKKNKSRRKKEKKDEKDKALQAKEETEPQEESQATVALQGGDQQPQVVLVEAEIVAVKAELESLPQPIEDVDPATEEEPKPVNEHLNVRKNNFFDDDSSSMSSSNQGSITYLKDSKEFSSSQESKKKLIKEESKKMTSRIIKNATLQQQAKPAQAQQPQQAQSKKKGKNKQNQQQQKQQQIEPPPSIFTFLASPSRTSGTPISQQKQAATDLRLDPDVKIPSRGKSSIQSKDYNLQDEIEHQRTMQELDSLFHSSSNDNKSLSSSKLRSSTVEASRGLVVSQFDLDELEDDTMSVNVNNVKKNKTVLESEQSQQDKQNQLTAEKAIKSLQLQSHDLQPQPTSAQKKKAAKPQKTVDEELEPTQEVVSTKVIAVEPELLVHAKSVQPSTATASSTKQREQPQTASFTRQQSQQQSTAQSAQKQQKTQQPAGLRNNQPQAGKQQQQNQSQGKTGKSNQEKSGNAQKQQFKAKPAQAAPTAAQKQPIKTFESYDSMFQNIYGAGATSGTQSQPTTTQHAQPSKPSSTSQAPPPAAAATPVVDKEEPTLSQVASTREQHQSSKSKELVSSSFNTQPVQQVEMVAKSISTSSFQMKTTTISSVQQTAQQSEVTSSSEHPQQKSQKLSKKAQKKIASLQEHGAMVTPGYFQQQQQQTTSVIEEQTISQGLPANYTDSSFQTTTSFIPTNQAAMPSSPQLPLSQQQQQMVQQQPPPQQPQQQPQSISERGVSFPHFYVNQQNHTTLNLNIFQQQPNYIPSQQQQQFYNTQQAQASNPFQPQNQQTQPQMQMPYQPQPIFPPQQQQSQFQPFYQQSFIYPQHHHHQQQQQMYYNQPAAMYQKPCYYAQPQQLQPYELIPMVDQASLDRRNFRCDLHEQAFHQILGEQIQQVQSKMDSLLQEAEEARQLCYDLISKIARDCFPEMCLSFEVYGSMATKLAIDTSDMDIAIYGIPAENRSTCLQQLHGKLQECKSVFLNQLILTASVPVIKLEMNFDKLAEDLKLGEVKVGKIKQIKIDLVMHDQAHNSQMHQTTQCAEYIKKQIIEHPFLKPLTITLKKYLTLKNLNSPFQGSMSSYGLVLLVLALLKDMARVHPHLEFQQDQRFKTALLGRVFTHFFMVYGDSNLFNEQTIINGNLMFELSTGDDTVFNTSAQGTRSLVIQDPCDAQNNVGKQIYNFFSNVQEQLNVTQKVLVIRFKEWQCKVADQEQLEHDKRAILQAPPRQQSKEGKSESLTQQIQDQIDCLQNEIQSKQQEMLDRVIMVNLKDFSCIYRDEVEERQKGLLQATKQMAHMLQPYESANRQHSFNTQLQKLFFHPMQLGMMPGGAPQIQQTQQHQQEFMPHGMAQQMPQQMQVPMMSPPPIETAGLMLDQQQQQQQQMNPDLSSPK